MKRFPALGSMLVEGANVLVNFLRVFLRLALSLPGAIELWRMGRRCPVVSLGHTLVESGCGSDLFSLFEMWESIDRAGAHFWRALTLVAMHVRDLGLGGTSQAASFIEGASQYGQATFSPSGGGLARSFSGLRVPIPELGSGMLNTFFAGKSSGSIKSISSALSVSVNPIRLARYSYELVAGWVSRILPIAIEGRGGAPSVAIRVAHVMGNHLLDSRGDFDRLVLLTMRQGCSGMSLMIGFTNPWARFVRKQCETVPDALNGTLNILVATTVVVPFVHCVCVPPKGIAVSFEDHLMGQCYYHAPDSMKGAILGVVSRVRGGAKASEACQSMLGVAKDSMSTALHRWFDTQFQAAEALGPSVSYLSDYLDPGGSACMDFEQNPFASVLIPEPYDFWGACGATSLCRMKCSPLFLAFEAEKAKALYRGPAVQSLSRTVESRFFQQVDRDAFMPFPILAMVQLGQCRGICPPAPEARNQNARSNPDTCIAVAGVGGDLLLTVHKYCVPASMGLSVSRAEAQTWAVAGSAGFAAEIVSVFFSETGRGDTLLVLRDHSGSPGPRRVENELLTVHSREMQDQFFFEELFGDPEAASELLLVSRLEDSDQALEAGAHATAITHMYIIPTDASGRPPWAFTRVHADDGRHYDLCWPLQMPAAGSAVLPERLPPRRCRNAPSVMRGIADDHQVPILLDYFTSVAAVVMVPTRQHPGSQLCLLRLTLSGSGASEERGDCHPVSGGFFAGTGASVSQVDRQATGVLSDFSGEAKWETVMYSGAVSRVGRTMAQNTLSGPLAAGSPMTFFVSKDPRVRVSWLSLSRVSVEGSGLATSSSGASSSVTVRMDIQLSCDQFSCTGCPSGRLQALCNALQQCVVEKCVGSPVDQRNPLCNVGVTIQKTFESYVAMAFSAWLVFVEGYSTVLQLSLERDRSMELRIESLDDAFFGEICVAKDLAASTTAIITSSVNAIVLAVGRRQPSDVDRLEQGAGDLGVGRFGAHATMISTSVNSLLYQLVLLPAYIFVALHKTFVCGGNQVLAIPSALSDFEITLGRADLQSALDRVAGTCMASYVQGCLGAPAERGYGKCAADVAQTILSAAQTIGVSYAGGMPLDPMLHQIDSALSYMEGIVSALQDVVQTSDTEKCRAPDFFVHKAPHCACGDEHVRIPLENRTQGIAQHAHWCSGMLRVPSAFGGFAYVYNPYSYEALLELLHLSKPSYATAQSSMLDEYLLCRSGNGPVGAQCHQLLASVRDFNSQQVSPLTVLQTCRDNYHAGRWDPAAWLLYDEEGLQGNERLSLAYPGERYDQDGRAYESGVGACLRGAASRDEGVTGCMQDFLGRGYATAFRYETTGQGGARNALVVDACKVFTGPARSPDGEVAQVFRRCASGWGDTGCQIPLIGWSVGSRNALPVANEHAVQALLLEERVALARSRYEDIRAVVVAALRAELDFEDDNLDVLLFSADGDALHQGFDCYVMGAYSRVDFWTPGPDGDLPVPLWARDAGGLGESREMDLPCGLDKLQGDHEPPFTCGSPTRRSVIKTMVRRFIGGERGEEGMVERLVREKVRELIAIWDSVDHYACQCEDGSGARPECCTSFEERWADTDLCPCLDGTRAHTCCRQDNYLPPGLALVDFDQINSTVVSEAILDMIPPFMEVAHTEAGNQAFMTHTAQSAGVPGTWNWATSPQALRRAVSAGILSSYVDIVRMDESEAGYPFRGDGASPDRTLWEACTGLLGQLMFSMPMRPVPVEPGDLHSAPAWTLLSVAELREVGIQFDPAANVRFEAPANAEPDETGQSMLQRFVTRLLNAAYDSSPLFWHHAMRHVPSDSLVCRHRAQPEPLSKSLHFRNRQLIPVDALDELPPVPVKGYAAAPLGGVGTECMCGWPKTATSRCMVPEDVCQSIGLDPCSYPATDPRESLRVERLVLESWDDSWVCPEMEFSDSWGVVPSSSQSLRDWFAGNDVESDVAEVLRRGRAGLRGANYRGLVSDRVASGKINPSERVSPLRSEDGLSSVSLFCVQDFLTSFDANSVAAAMVDDLFPVSRATKDSMPVASCLRFAIEYSKLRVLEMLSAIRDTGREVGAQQAVSKRWARRCQAQLDMMGMCRAHGVFQMRPEVERAYECPFSVSEPYAERLHYVTPGCLVYKFSDDRLYDPCLQPELCQGGGAPVPLASITRAVPFDPRDASRGEPMGYWPLTFQGATEGGNDRMAALRNALQGFDAASQVPRGLSSGFVERLVHGGGTLSPGHANTPGAWGSAEGMASESTGFCDGISDWWPEDWNQPVGYHVTLPCHASETGHRTFDSAFVVESGDGETVKMVYQHDMLRDRQAAHSEFGAAGLCRRGSYGMPRALTNTVRACVRDAKGAEYDAHVPARPRYGDGRSPAPEFEPERRCASTPYELPWHVKDPQDASVNMLSVGGVPMWDGIYTQGAEYPDQAQVIKQGVMAGSGSRDGWGEHCSEGALLSCDDQHPCIPTGGGDTALECFRGTCIRDRSATQTCYAHADCEANGMLCTGDGRCVRPVLQVENEHGADVEFQLFSERCDPGKGLGNNPPEPYDTYGASPWEDVPDALRMHGMCSYRGWHDYLGFHNGTLGPPARCTQEESDQHLCSIRDFKGDGSMWWDSDLHPDAAGFHDLWSTGRFRVHAHQCDRDYMHVQGHRGCSPVVLETEDPSTDFVHLLTAQLVPRQNPRGRLMRTFRRGRYIPLLQPIQPAGVSEPQWLTSGFMSMPEIGGKPFAPCIGMVSCHPDEFRVAGELRGRLRWPGNTVDRPAQHVGDWKPTAWKQAEGSECGMFGMKHEGGCVIDMAAAPFYWSICGTDRVRQDSRYSGAFADTRSACGTGSGQAIQRCQAIDNALADSSTFQSPTALQSLRHAINSLPDLLIQPIESQGRYLHATGCSSAMHALWQLDPYGVKGMYSTGGFPLPQVFSFHVFLVHTTLEVPYAFWHKCMLLEGQPLFVGSGTSDASMRGVVECDGWTRGHRVGDGSASAMYSTDPLGALRAVDGLITRASLAQAKEALYPGVLSALQAYQRLAPPDGKGVGADHSMVCHQSPRYLPAGSPAFTKECKASLVLWAQKGGVGSNFQLGNNNREGVPSSCYAFAEPLVLNQSTGRHRVNGAYARRVQDNFITGERAVKFFEWLYVYFNRTDFHTKHVRDLDFMDLKQVQDGNTWAGGVLMAEFHPAVMPGSRNFEVTPPDRYDGHVLTSNRETRLTQHHEIPCITPKDLEGHLECGGTPEHVPMDAQGCRDHEAEMLKRISRLVPDITDAVIRLNGELATATYVTPGLNPDIESAINIGGIFLSLMGPKGAVLAAAGQGFLMLNPAEERKLGRDPVNMTPDNLLRQIERALSVATNECLSRVSGSAEGQPSRPSPLYASYVRPPPVPPPLRPIAAGSRTCRNPAASRDEATAFSGLGQQFLTFSRGALDQEFDVYNEAALFDGTLDSGEGIESNFLEKKEDVQAFLVYCEGNQRCADELVNIRRTVVTTVIQQVSALLSEASRKQWYDCSHGPPPPSCIVPGEPLTEGSFHEVCARRVLLVCAHRCPCALTPCPGAGHGGTRRGGRSCLEGHPGDQWPVGRGAADWAVPVAGPGCRGPEVPLVHGRRAGR